MKLLIKAGTTSKRIGIFVQDSSQTDGRGLSGLVFNSAGLTWYYWREDQGNVGGSSVTLATATRGTFASGGFIEKDATNMPGFYEIGIPNAALATGADWVVMVLRGATNMAPVTIEIQLNVVSAADVQTECEDALVAKGLDHLVNASVVGADVADDSIIAKLVSKSATADFDDFVNTTDSLQAAADKWVTAMTEAYAADGVNPTPEQALFMLMARAGIFKQQKSGTTLTSFQKNKSNSAMTHTLDDPDDPTTVTRAT